MNPVNFYEDSVVKLSKEEKIFKVSTATQTFNSFHLSRGGMHREEQYMGSDPYLDPYLLK